MVIPESSKNLAEDDLIQTDVYQAMAAGFQTFVQTVMSRTRKAQQSVATETSHSNHPEWLYDNLALSSNLEHHSKDGHNNPPLDKALLAKDSCESGSFRPFVVDDCLSKMEAWRTAVHVVSQLLLVDLEIISGSENCEL